MRSDRDIERTPPKVHPDDERVVPMRLQRFLARAGVASRRGSEALMSAGRVSVNGGVKTELGTKVDPAIDQVAVDGVPVVLGVGAAYLMLNKPAGVLTTMSDPHGRPCVADIMPVRSYPGLFPVGRLDMDTTGLLLFTTDGDLGHALLHPSRHVWKTYVAVVDGVCREGDLEPLRRGITLDDGPCQPARCALPAERDVRDIAPHGLRAGTTAVRIEIREGRKNQVKRMLSKIGHPVLRLHRLRFGPLELNDLPCGSWRELTPAEVAALQSTPAVEEISA